MLTALELAAGAFLLWYSVFPIQVPQLHQMLATAVVVWAIAALITRSRELLSSSLFFHFSLLLAFFLRAAHADGWMSNWFSWMFLGAWCITVWLTVSEHDDSCSASLFLSVFLVSPLQVVILTPVHSLIGMNLWILAVLRLTWARYNGDQVPGLRITRLVLAFLLLSLVSSLFSLTPSHSLQFFRINCSCVLLYMFTGSDWPHMKKVLLMSYLVLVGSFALYLLPKEILALREIGAPVLAMRHFLLDHPNTIGPLFIVISVLILQLSSGNHSVIQRISVISALLFLGLLVILSYSRNSWIGYLVFWAGVGAYSMGKHLSRKSATRIILGLTVLLSLLALTPPIRANITSRFSDVKSIQSRLYAMQLGWKSVRDRPWLGAGWFSYYNHARYQQDPAVTKDLDLRWKFGAVHNHSLPLDMAEAGGIPMAVCFLAISFVPFRRWPHSPIVAAGILGLTLNNILDTACFWPVVYPHFWILLGIGNRGGFTTGVLIPRRILGWILPGLLIFSSFLPLIRDYCVQRGNLSHLRGESSEALSWLRWARNADPLDPEPLEALRDLCLDNDDSEGARVVLETLQKVQIDYPPYLVELARILAAEGKDSGAFQLLERARALDPYASLQEETYLLLASLTRGRDFDNYQKNLITALLRPIHPKYRYLARDLVDGYGVTQFLEKALSEIDRIPGPRDRVAALDHLYRNLMLLRLYNPAYLTLRDALQDRERIIPGEADYFADRLANLLFFLNRPAEIETLRAGTSVGETRVRAWQMLSQKQFDDARQWIELGLQSIPYPDTADLRRALCERTKDPEGLSRHIRIMESLPVLFRGSSEEDMLGHLLMEQRRYGEAAIEFEKLVLFDPLHPRAYWYAARNHWLAGETKQAQSWNRLLARLISDHELMSNLYRCRIVSSSTRNVYVTREGIPNEIGGMFWRTGIYFHPPSAIQLPGGMTPRDLSGEIGMVLGAWQENTDGVEFAFMDGRKKTLESIRIIPYRNSIDRGWVPFQWLSDHRSVSPTFLSNPIGNENGDWVMWAPANQAPAE